MALEVVRRVTDEGAYSNLTLAGLLGRAGLPPRDRELAAELAYGTLRRLLPIDRALAVLLDKPLAKAPPRARAALRLGAYQLLHTRIPDHAAVTETVGLVSHGERGLVNAVLRRLAADPPPPVIGTTVDAVSVRTGVAPWAVRDLQRLVGDEAEHAAEALATQAPLTVRVNTCAAGMDDAVRRLRDRGLRPEPGRLHPASLRLPGAKPGKLPGFAEGWFAVQDEASAWVVDVLDPQPGERIADVCAGPGGKAGDIACRSGSALGADVSLSRVGLVAETAVRLGVDISLLVQDARKPALRDVFDRVLVDAPCSGVGAARRRPELLWRPQRKDLASLARLQIGIAAAAASLLRPGGVLVYSVCTFPPAETDRICDALLERVPGLEPDPFPSPEGTQAPRARLWPHRHGTDAMFVARFRRRPGPE